MLNLFTSCVHLLCARVIVVVRQYMNRIIFISILLICFLGCGVNSYKPKPIKSKEALILIIKNIITQNNINLYLSHTDMTNSNLSIQDLKQTLIKSKMFENKTILSIKEYKFSEYDHTLSYPKEVRHMFAQPEFNIKPSHIIKVKLIKSESHNMSVIFGVFSKNEQWYFSVLQSGNA
jgi:hypothetical protein